MAVIDRKKLTELTGLPSRQISNYVGRGKVILLSDGMIDTSDPRNDVFIKKHSSRLDVKNDKNLLKDVISLPVVKQTVVKTNETTEKKDSENEFKSLAQLERDKLIADIEKKQADLEKALLINAKIKGEVIPFGLMKPLIAQNNQSITTEFKNAADELISNIAKKKSLSSAEVADLNKTLVSVINDAIRKATDLSIKNLSLIINDYQASIK